MNTSFEELKKISAHPTCSSCGKQFKITKPYQLYCSEQCENVKKDLLKSKRNSYFEKVCCQCGDKFRRTDERSLQQICDGCKLYESREAAKKRIKKIKEPKKKKLVSYAELNRRSEYNRVFRDSGWSHYLKGRKWDKI